jgi:hypothetical protein
VITPSFLEMVWSSLENALTMKPNLRNPIHPLIVSAAFVVLASAPVFGAGKDKGHDLLHLTIQAKLHNEGVISGAGGDVDLHYDQHGGKDTHQELHLHVKGLDTGTDYTLSAQDNTSNVVQVASFTADEHGNADLHFRDKGPKKPHDHAGHVDGQLPPDLEPVTAIAGLSIADTNGTGVLTADLTAPHNFQYMAKRDLGTGAIRGKLEINADAHHGKLDLEAQGLDAGTSYSLAVNGNVVTSVSADEHGHLHVHTQFQNSIDVLSLNSVEVLDASSNVVLSATFP